MQINLTGFLIKDTPVFMEALWKLLLEAQEDVTGVPRTFVEQKKEEMRKAREGDTRAIDERDRRARLDEMQFRGGGGRGDGRGGRGRGRGRGGRGGYDDRGGDRPRDAGWGNRGGPPSGVSDTYIKKFSKKTHDILAGPTSPSILVTVSTASSFKINNFQRRSISHRKEDEVSTSPPLSFA